MERLMMEKRAKHCAKRAETQAKAVTEAKQAHDKATEFIKALRANNMPVVKEFLLNNVH
jgi:hypothetical protein